MEDRSRWANQAVENRRASGARDLEHAAAVNLRLLERQKIIDEAAELETQITEFQSIIGDEKSPARHRFLVSWLKL